MEPDPQGVQEEEVKKETLCEACEGDGHDYDVIWAEGKTFCPVSHKRIWTEDEAEEMTEEELAEAQTERVKLVRPYRPAVWKVIRKK